MSRSAAAVQEARSHLLGLSGADGRDTDVAPEAQRAIVEMKEKLSAFTRAYMGCADVPENPKEIKKALMDLAHGYEFRPEGGVVAAEDVPADFNKYGFQLSFEVKRFTNPQLVGVIADFSIECGGDSVLLLFAPDGRAWKEVLHWQREPYKDVSGGTMALDYDVSAPDATGNWFVGIHDIAPWCSSTWSSIRYAAMRPSADAMHPTTILQDSAYMWWGNDDYGALKLEPGSFDLRFHSASIDAGIHNRVWIRHYAVEGNTAKRTQPVAASPRDFVDEWMTAPWIEAATWSDRSREEALRKWHERLSPTEDDNRLTEYVSVRKCAALGAYQVELAEETGKHFENSRSVYFLVAGGASGPFTMNAISAAPGRACRGQDLLGEMATK